MVQPVKQSVHLSLSWSRLAHSLVLDTRLQVRNYLYPIVIGVAAFLGSGSALFLDETQLRLLLPILFLTTAGGTGYIFIGALVLFEKVENTLDGLIVTPLRPHEYLLSKLLSLALLTLAEGVTLALTGFVLPVGGPLHWPLYLAGVVLTALFFTLIGFIVVVRYDTINAFLIPSIAIISLAMLPAIGLLDIWQPAWFYLIPSYAPMWVVTAAFRPVPPATLFYGLAVSIAAIFFLTFWALRAFRIHVIK